MRSARSSSSASVDGSCVMSPDGNGRARLSGCNQTRVDCTGPGRHRRRRRRVVGSGHGGDRTAHARAGRVRRSGGSWPRPAGPTPTWACGHRRAPRWSRPCRTPGAAHAAGHGPPRQLGRVAGLHVSNGGVPKMPVEAVAIGWRGLAGDRQASAAPPRAPVPGRVPVVGRGHRHAGRRGPPDLPGRRRRERHRGRHRLGSLRPGTRLQVGEALLEITVPALPCAKNARGSGAATSTACTTSASPA